jgi:hypothetical protein
LKSENALKASEPNGAELLLISLASISGN